MLTLQTDGRIVFECRSPEEEKALLRVTEGLVAKRGAQGLRIRRSLLHPDTFGRDHYESVVNGVKYTTRGACFVGGAGDNSAVFLTQKGNFFRLFYPSYRTGNHRIEPISEDLAQELLTAADYEQAQKLWPDCLPEVVYG